ncbi:type 1 glutamine amidotransferase domain-containing protein [Thalassobacillus sp. CUG 92003]|uniref:type 1 glutamine amidotransferase domain-containing protein n=1 Tax=Thalassobacillus sp. CUG 92003 TaxID=2736641 RepID=UPI0015E7D855|nr:type 1 glutamine amidotransferase domain-containing protein [Thalassobacillus sp. CUG 92003]
MAKKILMIVTNADQVNEDNKTGLWLSEFVEPYMEFLQAGFEVTAASIKGGKIPIDPNSYSNELPKEWDDIVMEPLSNTEKLTNIDPSAFDGVFLPGGHGTMFDFPQNETLQYVLKHFAESDKLIGAVCHGPAGFVGVTDAQGNSIVKGKKITGFTNEEESQTGLDSYMPFLLESKLSEEGATFVTDDAYQDHVVMDGRFITGQNPQSSLSTARQYVETIGK